MNILLVGAGAVGQVYGRHLARAGHQVTFFVKPRYAAELAAGLPLHRLGYLRTESEHWQEYAVVSTVDEVAAALGYRVQVSRYENGRNAVVEKLP